MENINKLNLNQVVNLIIENSNCCIKCGSSNISNEDESSQISCHNCSFQFDEDDYFEKTHIIATLRVAKKNHDADLIEKMDSDEFKVFIEEFVKDY